MTEERQEIIKDNSFAIDAWGLKIQTDGLVSIVAALLIGYALIKWVSTGKSIDHIKKIKNIITRKNTI